jgi:hypothetical protein
MTAAYAGCIFVFERLFLQDSKEFLQIFDKDIRSLPHEQGEGRVDDIGGGKAPVNMPRIRADIFR